LRDAIRDGAFPWAPALGPCARAAVLRARPLATGFVAELDPQLVREWVLDARHLHDGRHTGPVALREDGAEAMRWILSNPLRAAGALENGLFRPTAMGASAASGFPRRSDQQALQPLPLGADGWPVVPPSEWVEQLGFGLKGAAAHFTYACAAVSTGCDSGLRIWLPYRCLAHGRAFLFGLWSTVDHRPPRANKAKEPAGMPRASEYGTCACACTRAKHGATSETDAGQPVHHGRQNGVELALNVAQAATSRLAASGHYTAQGG